MLEQQNNYWQLSWASAQQAIALDNNDQGCSYARWYHCVQQCYQHILQQDGDSVLLYQPDGLQFSIWLVALAILIAVVIIALNAKLLLDFIG